MIYVLEGPDGTGKTTLARAIADRLNGSVIHSTYDKSWNMRKYHQDTFDSAKKLSAYKPVVLDRWAPSELVYGNVFRDGPAYDVQKMIKDNADLEDVLWVYCRNDNAAQNHLNNMKTRKEMFNSMTSVAQEYDKYVATSELLWVTFDFDKMTITELIDKLEEGETE